MGVTTTTNYGRAQVAWPDYAHDGGTALHAKIVAGVKKLSDHLDVRYTESQTLSNGGTFDFTHNFNLAASELDVVFYESNARVANAVVAASYTITELSANQIRITNISGGSKTFYALIFAAKTDPGKMLGYLATANATETTLLTYDIPNDKSALVIARVCARINATTANVWELKYMVEDNAGTTTVTLMEKTELEDNTALDAKMDASGGTARLRVIGIAGAVTWTAVLETTYV